MLPAFFSSNTAIAALGILLLQLVLFPAPRIPFLNQLKPFLFGVFTLSAVFIERKLNRAARAPATLFMRGAFTVLVFMWLAFVLGGYLQPMADRPEGWIFSIVVLYMSASLIPAVHWLRDVGRALSKKDETQAKSLLKEMTGETMEGADVHTLVRRALEETVVGGVEYLMAPFMAFMLGGIPVLLMCVVVISSYHAFGTAHPRQRFFGAAPRFLYEAALFIPSCVSGFIFALGSVVIGKSSPFRAVRMMLAQAKGFRPFAQGIVIAAFSGALGIVLGGPRRHDAEFVETQPWIGPEEGTARSTPDDLQRGTLLILVFYLIVMAVTAAVIAF